MRSVCVHLRNTNETEVREFLRHKYTYQKGPPWIHDVKGDACLCINFYTNAASDVEPEEWTTVVQALGTENIVSLIADVSGRHSGDSEVRDFMSGVLSRFEGFAQDEYTGHCWKLDEIISDHKEERHRFFDYLGWYEEMKNRDPQ